MLFVCLIRIQSLVSALPHLPSQMAIKQLRLPWFKRNNLIRPFNSRAASLIWCYLGPRFLVLKTISPLLYLLKEPIYKVLVSNKLFVKSPLFFQIWNQMIFLLVMDFVLLPFSLSIAGHSPETTLLNSFAVIFSHLQFSNHWSPTILSWEWDLTISESFMFGNQKYYETLDDSLYH